MTTEFSPLTAGALRLAIVQIAPVFLDAQATWEKIKTFALRAKQDGAEVIVWGESLLPGYPGWISIDSSDAQQAVYARYWDQAITLQSPLLREMRLFAREHKVMLIGGVAEREHGSTYATTLTIDTQGTIIGRHRKIKPTWRERLVWADGDAEGFDTHKTKIGKIGSLSCWENWLPLARTALYQQEEFIHVGLWPGNLELVSDITRFIAKEGRLWSVAASGLLRATDFNHLSAEDFPVGDAMRASPVILQNGGSQIVSPTGEIVAGPLLDEEGIVAADLTTKPVVMERQILDSSGHYSRNDLLELNVHRKRGPNTLFLPLDLD